MRSHTSCTSASKWLQSRTVLPLGLERQDQVLHLARADRVEARRRFVKQDEIGLLINAWARPMRRAMPLLYSRSFALAGLAVEADRVEQCRRRASSVHGGDLEQSAVEVKRLFAIKELVEIRLFGKEADALVDLGATGTMSQHGRLAARWEDQAEQELDRGRLARAVGVPAGRRLHRDRR